MAENGATSARLRVQLNLVACGWRIANQRQSGDFHPSRLRKNPFSVLTNLCKLLILRSAEADFRGSRTLFPQPARGSRDVELAKGRPQLQVRGKLSLVHLADVGTGAEPRILHVHQRIHHPDRDQRRHRRRTSQLPAGAPRHTTGAERRAHDGPAAVVGRRVRAGRYRCEKRIRI